MRDPREAHIPQAVAFAAICALALFFLAAPRPAQAQAWGGWQHMNSPVGTNIALRQDGEFLYGMAGIGYSNFLIRSRNPIAGWDDFSQGLSGLVYGLAVRNGDAVVCGGNGLWRRGSADLAWSRPVPGLNDTITALAFASHSLVAASGQAGRISRSLDLGDHWSPIAGSAGLGSVSSLAAWGDTLYACSPKGMWLSKDGGSSWNRDWPDGQDTSINGVVRNGEYVYAWTDRHVYRGALAAQSWERLPGPLIGNEAIARSLHAAAGILYLVTNLPAMFRSADFGSTWSRDTSWLSAYSYLLPNSLLAFGNGRIAANADGVFLSDDGKSWRAANIGLPGYAWGPDLRAFPDGRLFASGAGPFVSADRGYTWTSLPLYPIGSRTPFPFGRFLLADVQGQGLYRSSDDGATWDSVGAGGPFSPFLIPDFSAAGSDLYLPKGAGSLWHSGDSGLTWLPEPLDIGASLVKMSDGAGGPIAATDSGLFAFDAARKIWAPFSGGLGHREILDLAWTGSAWLVAVPGGVYRAADARGPWSPVSDANLHGQPRVLRLGPGRVFLGTDSGVYVSDLSGLAWKELGAPQGHTATVTSLAVLGDTVFASQTYGGIWKRAWKDLPDAARAFRIGSARNRRAIVALGRGKPGFAKTPSEALRDARGRAFEPATGNRKITLDGN